MRPFLFVLFTVVNLTCLLPDFFFLIMRVREFETSRLN